MTQLEECIFCTIVAKRAPANIVYESEDTLAFLDVHPIVPGHVLVVPKRHCRNLLDFDEASAQGLLHAEKVVARALRLALQADGLTVLQANERAGGQSVFHYHAHLVPRFIGDGLLTRPEHIQGAQKRAIDGIKPAEIADKIRAQIVDQSGNG
jgi:histidine triad (HIT) family protein